MKRFFIASGIFLLFALPAAGKPSVSPLLYFLRDRPEGSLAKVASPEALTAPVTVRFDSPPDAGLLSELEGAGLVWNRIDGEIVHTRHIYAAEMRLDALDTLASYDAIVRIEATANPSRTSPLDVSVPLVEANEFWNLSTDSSPIDGTGIIIADVDTGIDYYHPAFFKLDGGRYHWIDVDRSGGFDPGIDAVDLNRNGSADQDEILRFWDASFQDNYAYDGLFYNQPGVYEADIDWLYCDTNGSGVREYGPEHGFGETSPSFGEPMFVVDDRNHNNRLDMDESLIALGTSKVVACYDRNGVHLRGVDLLTALPDIDNHGTSCFGIAGGQWPGRRFTGMAPGAEFISIARNDKDPNDMFAGVIWARDHGADLVMYEFASWVQEFLDGSSNREIFISELHEDGLPQLTAAGNLAGPTRKKHARFDLGSGSGDSLRFTVPESFAVSEVYLSILWRGDTAYMPVTSLRLPGGTTLTIPGNGDTVAGDGLTALSGLDQSPKETARLDIVLTADSAFSGDFTLVFQNTRRLGFTFDAFVADNKTAWMHGTQFQNHLTDEGTVTSPGTAEKCITVAAYDPRGYRDVNGDIGDFSSWGPTIDGRRAIDITAPGVTIISPASHVPGNTSLGGYLDFAGTSAALPHVAGCAALLLQMVPGMTPENLESALYTAAEADQFTGSVPNDIWGYGKLKAGQALQAHFTISGNDTPFLVTPGFPNPFDRRVTFGFTLITDGTEQVTIEVYSAIGQHIRTIATELPGHTTSYLAWDGADDQGRPTASGVYLVRVSCAGSSVVRRVLRLN